MRTNKLSSGSSEEIFSSFTSFPAVQWNLQASQSFSPHRSRFNQHTPRDNLNYLIPSLCRHALLHTSSRGEEIWARGKEKWDHKATVCYWGLRSRLTDWLTDWLTDRNLTSDPQRVSPTHNILLPNTTTTQQQALFNTSEGRGQREGLFERKCQGYKKKKCEGWVEVKDWGAF